MESSINGRPPPQLKVFISFRGRDVRDSFFKILKETLIKNGVNVLTDDDAVRGKPISENLLKLIRESSIAVVIFSKNFSESQWCLDELVEIKKRMDVKKLEPLPIFFAVDTSHVKLYGESRFKKNLKSLEEEERRKARNISTQALEDAERRFLSWEEALKSVTECMGLPYKSDRLNSLKGALVSIAICLGFPINTCGQQVFVNKIAESVKVMLYKIAPQYPVFVSFRGLDVYYKFASTLKACMIESHINVLVEKEPIGKESLVDKLFKEIQQCKIAVVIFTKTYTRSEWCLNELVEIRKCMEKNMMRLVPIFYEVDPRDMILDDHMVEKWSSRYDERYDEDKINQWKSALAFVANRNANIFYPRTQLEVDFIEEVIQEVKNVLVNILIEESSSSSSAVSSL